MQGTALQYLDGMVGRVRDELMQGRALQYLDGMVGAEGRP